MLKKVSTIDKLNCIHQLFCQMNESNKTREEQESLESAYWLFVEALENDSNALIWNQSLIERLFCMHFGSTQTIGFEFWELSLEPYDPLFFRETFIQYLKKLNSHRQSLLIISGLRYCIAGNRTNSTIKFKEDYANEITFIREMCHHVCRHDTIMNLLIL